MTAQNTTRQLTRRVAVAASAAALIAAVLTAPVDAGGNQSRLTRLTVNRTMALPGVTLPPGTYTFEIANTVTSANVVMVSSRSAVGRKVHYLGLTHPIERPHNLPGSQVITIGEVPAGEPVPIRAWFPIGYSTGYQFVYE
jgi:hypothetical protein